MFAIATLIMAGKGGWNKLLLVGIPITILENLFFGLTMCMNPGLASRDVSIHSKSYLNRVKTI